MPTWGPKLCWAELVPCGVPLGACHSCVALTGAVCGQGTQNGVVRFYLPSVRRSVLAAYTKASKKRLLFSSVCP